MGNNLELKIKDWYTKEFKDDELGAEIKDGITFADLDKALTDKKDVYDVLGVGDSIIRERCFEKLSDLLGVDYDNIYYRWLGTDDDEDGLVDKVVNALKGKFGEAVNKPSSKLTLTEDESEVDLDALCLDFLDQYGWLEKKDGYYLYEVTPYNDSLDAKQAADFLDKCHSIDEFKDETDSLYDYYDVYYDDFLKEFREYLEKAGIEDYDEDLAQEALFNYLAISADYDYWLDDEYRAHIIIDTGDANYEFSLNPNDSYYAPEDFGLNDEEVLQYASLVWLVKQQGHTVDELKSVLAGNKSDNKFMDSVADEVFNATSSLNAVCFLCKATLRQLLEFKPTDTITISKCYMCGLFDPINGGGSVLDVDIEKPVVIPGNIVGDFGIDAGGSRYGYDVDDVYGLTDKAYDATISISGATNESLTEDVEDNLGNERLDTPRGTFKIYKGTWRDFKNEPDADQWGFWFDHSIPENADWNDVEKWYKIVHNWEKQHAIAVLYRDLAAEKQRAKEWEEKQKGLKESKTLTERRWNAVIRACIELRDALSADRLDVERVREAIIACYDELYDKGLIDDYDHDEWTEEVRDCDFESEWGIDEDAIDYELDELYDLCDNIGAFLAVTEADLDESLSQEIGQAYRELSAKYGVDADKLVSEFMKAKYPKGFPDFNGDVIYSEKYWNEFVDWCKQEKGVNLGESCKSKKAVKEDWRDKPYEGKLYQYKDLQFELLWLEHSKDRKDEWAILCTDYDDAVSDEDCIGFVDYETATDEDVMKVIEDNYDNFYNSIKDDPNFRRADESLKESKQASYTVGGYEGKDDPMAKKDIRKASLYDVDADMEQLDDGSWELVITGDVDKVKDYVDNYLGLDSTGLDESLKEDAKSRRKFYTKDYFINLVSWDEEDCDRLHDYLNENPQVVKYAKSALKRDHKRYSKGETDKDYLDMVDRDLEEQEYYLNNFSDAVFRLDTIVRDNLFKAIIDGIKKYGADTLKESVDADKVLYIIKDSHGNQLSAPNPNDDELWDRVEAMEARGRKGLSVVVYTGKKDESLKEGKSTAIGYVLATKDGKKFLGVKWEPVITSSDKTISTREDGIVDDLKMAFIWDAPISASTVDEYSKEFEVELVPKKVIIDRKTAAPISLKEDFDYVFDILVDGDYIDIADYNDGNDHISDIRTAREVRDRVKKDYPDSKVEISKHSWDEDNHYKDEIVEDTVKQGNNWVNKGKEGTHGKFKTKKAADAQRKAMFANGYKESLEEDSITDIARKYHNLDNERSYDELVGLDISDARKKLGYWWRLDRQDVRVGSDTHTYTFERPGVGTITLTTDKTGKVIKVLDGRYKPIKLGESLKESADDTKALIDFLKSLKLDDEVEEKVIGDWTVNAWTTEPGLNFSRGFYIVQIDNDKLNKHFSIFDCLSQEELEYKRDRVIKDRLGKSLKESKELDRQAFVSLVKLGDNSYDGYSILNDGNFVERIYAKSDDDAIKQFRAWLDKGGTKLKESLEGKVCKNDGKELEDILTKEFGDGEFKHDGNFVFTFKTKDGVKRVVTEPADPDDEEYKEIKILSVKDDVKESLPESTDGKFAGYTLFDDKYEVVDYICDDTHTDDEVSQIVADKYPTTKIILKQVFKLDGKDIKEVEEESTVLKPKAKVEEKKETAKDRVLAKKSLKEEKPTQPPKPDFTHYGEWIWDEEEQDYYDSVTGDYSYEIIRGSELPAFGTEDEAHSWAILGESADWTSDEILAIVDKLNAEGVATTPNKAIADAYASNENPYRRFEVSKADDKDEWTIKVVWKDDTIEDDEIEESLENIPTITNLFGDYDF